MLIGRAPHVASIAHRLRDLVLEVDPSAVEVVRLGDRAATYGVGPRKMIDGCCYLMPLTDPVNLGFCRGVHLPDSDGLLEGTGKSLRHVKVRSVLDVERPGVRRLIVDALHDRRSPTQ